MEKLLEQFVSIPGMLGWAVAIAMIGAYVLQANRMVKMADRNTQTVAALNEAQAGRQDRLADLAAAIKHLTTLVDERLPRGNGR